MQVPYASGDRGEQTRLAIRHKDFADGVPVGAQVAEPGEAKGDPLLETADQLACQHTILLQQ